MPLLLAFLAIPMIEIALFITVGGWLTLWPTLGLVLLTGIVGTLLVRQQGLAVLRELQMNRGALANPLSPLAHGAIIVVAGILLITPGFFTDTLGFLLLVPRLRSWLIAQAAARFVVIHPSTAHRQGGIIDGEFIDLDTPRGPPPRP